VTERSKARVCGRSLPGIAGSNPAGGMDVCVVCCTIRTKGKANKDKAVEKKYRKRTLPPPPKSRRKHGCLSVVSVLCSQVEVSAKGRSPVQRSPTNYSVLVCGLKTSRMRRPWPGLGCCSRHSWFRSSPSLFRPFILLEVIT
jgi:hypothetical protein